MKSSSLSRATHAILSAVLLAGLSHAALAESACKGLEQRQCQGKAECTWVEGYVRKDGVKVAAYCKSAGKSSGSSSAADKKATTK
jgi:hypothetical protein